MLSRVNCFIHFTFFNTIPVYIITRRYSTSFMNCVFDQQNFFLWIQWDHNLTISIKFNLKYQILNNDYTWHHQNKIILSNIVVDTDLSIFHIFSLSQIFKWCHFLNSFCTSTSSTSGRWLSDWVLVFLCSETWTGFKLQDTWALFNLISSLESGHSCFCFSSLTISSIWHFKASITDIAFDISLQMWTNFPFCFLLWSNSLPRSATLSCSSYFSSITVSKAREWAAISCSPWRVLFWNAWPWLILANWLFMVSCIVRQS